MNPLRALNPALTWAAMPAAQQAKIGALAIEWAFSTFVSGIAHAPADRLCDAAIRDEAERRSNDLLSAIPARIEAALPDLFGPDGEDPAWAWRA